MNVYAIVFAAGGYDFDKAAELTTGALLNVGLEPLFLSNPYPMKDRESSDPDFDVCLFSNGRPVDSLDSENQPRDEQSTLEHLVTVTTRLLSEIRERVEPDYGEIAEQVEAAVRLANQLEPALDAWDGFEREIRNPEES